jgi:hypothetical protein
MDTIELHTLKQEAPYSWKLWVSLNSIIAAICFTYASLGYFTFIIEYTHGEETGGWVFSIACFFTILANESEWSMYTFQKHRLTEQKEDLDINYIFIHIGALFFLIGGILFSPFAQSTLYAKFIPIGGFILFLSYLSKYNKLKIKDEDSHDIKIADLLYSIAFLIYAIGGILLGLDSCVPYLDWITLAYTIAGVLCFIASIKTSNKLLCNDNTQYKGVIYEKLN